MPEDILLPLSAVSEAPLPEKEVAVTAPPLVTLSWLTPPTCRFRKSPVKAAGFAPIYVPLALPPAMAPPRRITLAVALASGVPLKI